MSEQLIQLVGGTFTPEQFTRYLEKVDPCFGKRFARSAPECRDCRIPVIVDGRVRLLNEVCELRTKGARSLAGLQALTSRDILTRLEQGRSALEICREVMGEGDPKVVAAAARALVYRRFGYIKQQNPEITIPPLPSTAELQNGEDSSDSVP